LWTAARVRQLIERETGVRGVDPLS
jgi:hypothetical protein